MKTNLLPQILLTNDDGIDSPGLWALVKGFCDIADVTVVAPREQFSAASRSHPLASDRNISEVDIPDGQLHCKAYAIGGSPAQAVLHAILEIMDEKPDLIISGINYGENLGMVVSMSGTIGAAMEGAVMGIPGIAVSQQLHHFNHLEYSDFDFTPAAFFTTLFARKILQIGLPNNVDFLKLDIPADAHEDTPWQMTCLSRHPYFIPTVNREGHWKEGGKARVKGKHNYSEDPSLKGTDAYTLYNEKQVSVTPMSIDLTAGVNIKDTGKFFQ
ncbi:MAG: 5'/3'-nucleotidase SurE [Anaerolineaceae bacterium]|nr:5'/3'-nucleotidase SurE [Anaerolineaceae bacterium]